MTQRLVSFDGTESCTTHVDEPDRHRSLLEAVHDERGIAFRGAGLSYCLASAAPNGRTISTAHLDRVLRFDADLGLISVEPGLTVGALSDLVVARDRYFPVLPGHPSITVGGCAGFNVHGKTQHNVGHFSDHVESLTLLHPDHGELQCSATENPQLFELTIGGMGLTGCIIEITLRLQPLAGRSVRRRGHAVVNLTDAVSCMRALSGDADALYSWNDLNVRGDRFGQGVVYEEHFEPGALEDRVRYRHLSATHRRRLPRSGWTSLTAHAANRAYSRRERMRSVVHRSVHDAAFPINGAEIYYQMFGARGFREYQLVIPHEAWADAASEVERALEVTRVPITLGSLKLFAGTRRHLWFRGEGICLTIDAPADSRTKELFRRLDRISIDHGAIVNLSKDSRLDGATIEALFPELDGFREELARFDPRRRVDTPIRRRLEV